MKESAFNGERVLFSKAIFLDTVNIVYAFEVEGCFQERDPSYLPGVLGSLYSSVS